MNETTWHPDTCECVITFQWDRPGDTPRFKHATQTCLRHRDKQGQLLFDCVLAENRRKNQLLLELLARAGDLQPDEVDFLVTDDGIKFTLPPRYSDRLPALASSLTYPNLSISVRS